MAGLGMTARVPAVVEAFFAVLPAKVSRIHIPVSIS